MIPYLFNFICLALGIFSGVRPYTFLGNYILIQTFFMMEEYKVDYSFFRISSYRVFAFTFLTILLINTLKNKQWKESLIFRNYKYIYPVLAYLLMSIMVIYFHYYCWGEYPAQFVTKALKSSWPFLLILVSLSTFDLKRTFLYLAGIAFLIILILAPSSFQFFYDTAGSSFFRLRGNWTETVKYTGSFLLKGQIEPLIYLSENAALVWSIFSTPLILMIGGIYQGFKVKKWQKWGLFVFIGLIVCINQSGKMIAFFFLQLLVLLFFKFDTKRKRRTFVGIIALGVLIAGLFVSQKDLRDKFVKEEINLAFQTNVYQRRLPLIKYTLAKTIYESPWKGFGWPRNFNRETVLPSGIATFAQATGHSEGVDYMFYFGIPFGLLASVLYWFPFLLFLLSFKRLWYVAREHYIILGVTFTIALMTRFIAELGRDVYTDVIFVYLFVLFLKFHYKKGSA